MLIRGLRPPNRNEGEIMTIHLVVDLGFGDSGKGAVVSKLARELGSDTPVIRFGSGPQAAHQVISKDKDIRHVFSSFGSGTLTGNKTVWDSKCLFNPRAFLNERDALIGKGVLPSILIHSDCPVITSYDIAFNEVTLAEQNKKGGSHGTTGHGIAATTQRELDGYHLSVQDLITPIFLTDKLLGIQQYYKKKASSIDYMSYAYKFNTPIDHDISNAKDFAKLSKSESVVVSSSATSRVLEEAPYGTIILESAQGILIDPEHGVFPYVTRHSVLPSEEYITKLNSILEIYAVTRSYHTRHGAGPFPGEKLGYGNSNPFEVNERNVYQGDFRSSYLNMDLLEYSMNKLTNWCNKFPNDTSNLHLVITCMDLMDDKPKVIINGEVKELADRKEFFDLILKYFGQYLSELIYTESPYLEDEFIAVD